MQVLHLGQDKITYIANEKGIMMQLSNLIDIFLGGRKTSRSKKFMTNHLGSLEFHNIGRAGCARFLDLTTFQGPFLSAIPPESYEYLHATEFIKVIRSLKPGDRMPEFIPDPVGAGINPHAMKKVTAPSARKRPRPHAAAEYDGRQHRPEKKEPLEITMFDPSVIASVGGHAVMESTWQQFGGNVWEFSVFVYSVIEAKSSAEKATSSAEEAKSSAEKAKSSAEEAKSRARVEALREEVEEALARQRQLDIKTATEEAKSSAEEAKSKARVKALREEAVEALAKKHQLDIKTTADVQRPAETVILLNIQRCRANHCVKDSVNGDSFCTFHQWN